MAHPSPPPLRLAFMGSPDFAVPSLCALAEAGHEIACVFTQPPRPRGRGQRQRTTPVHALALERGWPLRTPETLRDRAEQEAFRGLALDAAIVVAYGLILPRPILEAPRLGCLNVHASLLPRWRGAAPIQHAILAGDGETGITIMKLDEGLDSGPILLQEAVAIGPETTAAELHDRLALIGARLIVEALADLAAGILTPRPQPGERVTYAAKLTREAGRLDWRRPASELERRVRALSPWPGAFVELRGLAGAERVKVLAAQVVANPEGAAPGTVLDRSLTIACGENALRPTRVQRPGRAEMDTQAFLRGFALAPGTDLPLPDEDA